MPDRLGWIALTGYLFEDLPYYPDDSRDGDDPIGVPGLVFAAKE